MLAALDSERYATLVAAMSELLRTGPVAGWGERPAVDAAPALVGDWRRRARREGGAIGVRSPDADYHEYRLTVKKLRYVLEFFAPLYPQATEAYTRQVTRLLTLLGDHQDAVLASQRYAALAQEEAERLGKPGVRAANELAANAAAEAESFRWKFPKRYARLRGPRWHALKDAMAIS